MSTFLAHELGLHVFPDLTSRPRSTRPARFDHFSFGAASRAELIEWQLSREPRAHGAIVTRVTALVCRPRPLNIALALIRPAGVISA